MTNEPRESPRHAPHALRPLADEVVIAADARVDAATLAGYAAPADRLFTVDFLLYERHLRWLQAQCTGDWILRFDGDELASAALVRRLPELLERRDVHQYWIRRAWVYPDAAKVLDELPWSTDYLNRLARNDGTLSFAGIQHGHANPVSPSAYVEQPVYHLELLLEDVASRRSKALRYRWLRRDVSVHAHDAPRSQLPASLKPGATALVPLQVLAPSRPDPLVLEIDLVHEDMRRFATSERIRAQVRKPDRETRQLRETRSRARRGRGELLIPRVVHRIWLGDAPLPPEMAVMGATFAEHHPDWEMRLWGDDDLDRLGISAADRARARTRSELSNLVRYEILRREGGVYVDTDVECRRELTPLLRGVRACAALELPGRLGTAVLAAVPGHPVFERAARESRHTLGLGMHSADANGPYFLTLVVEQEDDFTIFETRVFYPYLWDEPERAEDSFPDAYLVHHWAGSWMSGYVAQGML